MKNLINLKSMKFFLSFMFMMLAFFVSAISVDNDVGISCDPIETELFNVGNSTSVDALALDGRLFDEQSWRKEFIKDVANSNETIIGNPDLSNVNVHFGSINFLDRN